MFQMSLQFSKRVSCYSYQNPMYAIQSSTQEQCGGIYSSSVFQFICQLGSDTYICRSEILWGFWLWKARCILCCNQKEKMKEAETYLVSMCNEKSKKLNSGHESMRTWVCWRDMEVEISIKWSELKICISREIKLLFLSSRKPGS